MSSSESKRARESRCELCFDFDPWQDGSQIRRTFVSIRQAAADGCAYCDIIRQAIERTLGPVEEDKVILIWSDSPWPRVTIDQKIEIFQLPGNTNSLFPSEISHAVSGNTRTNLPLGQIQRWLRECLATHEHCSSSAEEFPVLPKRIIDVAAIDDSQSVRLAESLGQRAQYLCLSHCWGTNSVSLKTTKADIDKKLKRIEWSSLPKTFQDAIEIARLLGQRYIWIDSLCILQDDRQDWEEQSIHMASIYQNAYLTLAATKARNGREGLFNMTNKFEATILSGLDEDGGTVSLFCRTAIPHWYRVNPSPNSMTQFLHYPVHIKINFPLLHRAWVLQERLLSPRILHFGPAELLWECCERFTCECRDGVDNQRPESYPKVQYTLSLRHDSHISRPAMWRNIVDAYTHLAITKHEDRLPGLQGIARQLFQDKTPLKLLSGLWKETLLQDLLWRSLGNPHEAEKGNNQSVPTWSWATMNTGVKYYPDATSIVEHADIQACHVQDVHDDRTIVLATSLKLSALVLPGKIIYEGHRKDFTHTVRFVFDQLPPLAPQEAFEPWGLRMCHPDWDFSLEDTHHIKSGTVLYCLFMATIHRPAERREWGLLVKHTNNGRMQFERVGCFIKRHSLVEPDELVPGHVKSLEEVFQNAERTIITLV